MYNISSFVFSTIFTILILHYNFPCSTCLSDSFDDGEEVQQGEDATFLSTGSKRGGGRNFHFSDSGTLDKIMDIGEKRGGGRNFQLNGKRVGGENFKFSGNKRGGARMFLVEESNAQKRGGGRLFQFREAVEQKRGGARNFRVESENEKRSNALQFIDTVNKRGGAHTFYKLLDGANQQRSFQQANKRGGARHFAGEFEDNSVEKRFAESSAEKRAGARPFFGSYALKRGGGRYFSSPYSGYYSGGFRDSMFGFDKRGGGHRFAAFYPSSAIGNFQIKRAGARNFVGEEKSSEFLPISSRQFYSNLVKAADDETRGKRSGARAFGNDNLANTNSWNDFNGDETSLN